MSILVGVTTLMHAPERLLRTGATLLLSLKEAAVPVRYDFIRGSNYYVA